ncbi:zf-HC2 domain-containing protein [Planotetraspora sp. A-T 1434]|uniref:zf-HC2 domain-containing protein n=1 Tax=Planotetraspora sp. A-T 1434 TaxID=2979219 RepID=UPI0021C20070|nr:zf-HC2 domain-containing protein [Planotetraspora sp. A-T 1434]MCT9935358.1 zf-HC2 domain-containing protein [Planotetraspora sp. A-T 1434]
MNGTWHIPSDLLERYLGGDLDVAQVMSVEAHLVRCARCRTAVPGDETWLAASWERIEDAVGSPRPRPAERVLRHLGVPRHLARLLVATPTLSRAWLAAVTAVLTFAIVAAHAAGNGFPAFLTVAPVLPLAGIALAYGRWVDPAHESHAATPLAGPRLLLLRALAVLVTAIALTGLAAPLLPAMTAAWLLPSLALAGGCLALATRVPLPLAAAALGAGWIGVVAVTGGLTGDWSVPFGPTAQVVYGCAAPVLALVLYSRRHRLDPGEPQ